MLYLQKISAYRGNIISTIVDDQMILYPTFAYRGNMISTIVLNSRCKRGVYSGINIPLQVTLFSLSLQRFRHFVRQI